MLSLPLRDPKARTQISSGIQLRTGHDTTGQDRARWSSSVPFQPTASHTSWSANGTGLHMQALKQTAATVWGLTGVLSTRVLCVLGRLPPFARANKSSLSAAQHPSCSVTPSRRNMQLLISPRLPFEGILAAYWLPRPCRHCPAAIGLQDAGMLGRQDCQERQKQSHAAELNAMSRTSSFEPR